MTTGQKVLPASSSRLVSVVPISLWPVLIKSAFPPHSLSTGAENCILDVVLPAFPLLLCVLGRLGSTDCG